MWRNIEWRWEGTISFPFYRTSPQIRIPVKPPSDAEHLREFVDQVILVTRSQGIGPRGPVIVEAAGQGFPIQPRVTSISGGILDRLVEQSGVREGRRSKHFRYLMR